MPGPVSGLQLENTIKQPGRAATAQCYVTAKDFKCKGGSRQMRIKKGECYGLLRGIRRAKVLVDKDLQ